MVVRCAVVTLLAAVSFWVAAGSARAELPAQWCSVQPAAPRCLDGDFGGCVEPRCREVIDAQRDTISASGRKIVSAEALAAINKACGIPGECREITADLSRRLDDLRRLAAEFTGCSRPMTEEDEERIVRAVSFEETTPPTPCETRVLNLRARILAEGCRIRQHYHGCEEPVPPPIALRCGFEGELPPRERRLCAVPMADVLAVGGPVPEIADVQAGNPEAGDLAVLICRRDKENEIDATCTRDPLRVRALLSEGHCTAFGVGKGLPGGEIGEVELEAYYPSEGDDGCRFGRAPDGSCPAPGGPPAFSPRTVFERFGGDQPDAISAIATVRDGNGTVRLVHVRVPDGGTSPIRELGERVGFGVSAQCSSLAADRLRAQAYELRRILLASEPAAEFVAKSPRFETPSPESARPETLSMSDCARIAQGGGADDLLCWRQTIPNLDARTAVKPATHEYLTVWRPAAPLAEDRRPVSTPLAMRVTAHALHHDAFIAARADEDVRAFLVDGALPAGAPGRWQVLIAGREPAALPARDVAWLETVAEADLALAQEGLTWWLARPGMGLLSETVGAERACWRRSDGAVEVDNFECGPLGRPGEAHRPFRAGVDGWSSPSPRPLIAGDRPGLATVLAKIRTGEVVAFDQQDSILVHEAPDRFAVWTAERGTGLPVDGGLEHAEVQNNVEAPLFEAARAGATRLEIHRLDEGPTRRVIEAECGGRVFLTVAPNSGQRTDPPFLWLNAAELEDNALRMGHLDDPDGRDPGQTLTTCILGDGRYRRTVGPDAGSIGLCGPQSIRITQQFREDAGARALQTLCMP